LGLVGFFLIELDLFYSLFFISHIVKKKIIFEKIRVIKLYKVTKIKRCGETTIHPTLITSWITIVIHNVLLFFFVFDFLLRFFFVKYVFVDIIF
jgi:hypothetical protein